MAGASVARKARIFHAMAAEGLRSGAMVERALPEDFRVGATDVIGVEGEGVGEATLVGEAIANLADARGEERGNILYGFVQGQAGRPLLHLCQGVGIGGDPIDLF